jgi:hypothetical protein
MNSKVINPFQNQRPTYSDVEIKMMKNQTLSQMWEHLGDVYRKMTDGDAKAFEAYRKSARYLKVVIDLAESQIEKDSVSTPR